MKVIGHTIHTRIPHRGPASGVAQLQMSMQIDWPLRDERGFRLTLSYSGVRLHLVTDRPQKGGHLACDRCCDQGLAFASGH
jgi:hypothetical protein